jgi:hypothetical protein
VTTSGDVEKASSGDGGGDGSGDDVTRRLAAEAGEAEVDAEVVVAVVEGVARRISDVIANRGETSIRAAVLEALEGEAGALAVLASAYDEGREDATRDALIGSRVLDAADIDPGWGDVDGVGLRKTIQRETNACERCSHATVCVVARTIPPEFLIVVSRCLAFAPRAE